MRCGESDAFTRRKVSLRKLVKLASSAVCNFARCKPGIRLRERLTHAAAYEYITRERSCKYVARYYSWPCRTCSYVRNIHLINNP